MDQPTSTQRELQFKQCPPVIVDPYKPSKLFSLAKVVLGAFNLVFAIVAFGMSLGLLNQAFVFDTILNIIIIATASGITIVWQIAEFLTRLFRQSHRPIHPGAHVGIHLIMWIVNAFIIALVSMTLYYTLTEYTINPDCGEGDDEYYNYSSSCGWSYLNFDSTASAYRYIRIFEALDAFVVLMTVAHFTLFVMACVETHARRKQDRQTKVVYMVASKNPVDGELYYSQVLPQMPKAAATRHSDTTDPNVHGHYAPDAPVSNAV